MSSQYIGAECSSGHSDCSALRSCSFSGLYCSVHANAWASRTQCSYQQQQFGMQEASNMSLYCNKCKPQRFLCSCCVEL